MNDSKPNDVRSDFEAIIQPFDSRHPMVRSNVDAMALGLTHQRIEHRPGAVRIREQFPIFLDVHFDAEFTKEGHRLLCGERSQNSANDMGTAAAKIRRRHRDVSYVAPPAAAPQNLRPEFLSAVQG